MTAKEMNINSHGLNFSCIYGIHINGGFVAILNWGVAAELSDNGCSVAYNTSKILEALERSPDVALLPTAQTARSEIARELAEIIGNRISERSGKPPSAFVGGEQLA